MLRYFFTSMMVRGVVIGMTSSVAAAPVQVAPAAKHRLIETLDGAQAMRLQSVKIDGEISGGVAETTVRMVFFNPNKQATEGRVQFPLLAGQQIVSFSLDVGGKLRQAVPIDKSQGRQIAAGLAQEKKSGAIAVSGQGGGFNARIAPIAAGGIRTLEFKYAEPLARHNGQWAYRLPLDYGPGAHDFSIDLKVHGAAAVPVAKGMPGTLDFSDAGAAGYQAHLAKKNISTTGVLDLLIKPSGRSQTFVQERDGDTYFVAEIQVDDAAGNQAQVTSLSATGATSVLAESADSSKGVIRVAGKLLSPEAELLVKIMQNGKTQELTVPIAASDPHHPLAAFLWASYRIHALEKNSGKASEIANIAYRFGLATRDTSLVVFDNLADYARYDVTPPLADKAALAQLKQQSGDHLKGGANLVEQAASWWGEMYPVENLPKPEIESKKPAIAAKSGHLNSLAAKSAPGAVQEVHVTGIRAGLQQSLNVKRRAEFSNVEVITAEDIGKMPDKNVADSLQHLPGVTIPISAAGNWFSSPSSPVQAVAPMQAVASIQAQNTERYQHNDRHGIVLASEAPVSTFSIDVDTGSYSNVRRILNQGRLPPPDAVRVEEMVNYFPYDYPLPKDDAPFAVSTELFPTPWNPNTLLLRIGVQAADPAKSSLPPANLVFLVDVSGSMSPPERLPLLQSALKLVVEQLRPQDHVSLVTYAGHTRVALEPTPGDRKEIIKAAIDALDAGGSTAGAAGIDLAYQMAQEGFLKHGINRILLATDGDFNVGVTDFETLKARVAEKRKSGISLSTLGFGTDNYNDKLMEQLADAGDGAYSYIDNLSEAQKVLVHEFTSTLATVAGDVKIQLEFNPANVLEYRQIGFENRALKREDFNNDKVDAGDIGAGHRVTALYEITLTGQSGRLDPLRYAARLAESTGKGDELGFLRLRYKKTHGAASELMEFPVKRDAIHEIAGTELGFAAAVAAFGQRLGDDGKYLGKFDFPQIRALAEASRGKDKFGYRGQFLEMVKLAEGFAGAKGRP